MSQAMHAFENDDAQTYDFLIEDAKNIIKKNPQKHCDASKFKTENVDSLSKDTLIVQLGMCNLCNQINGNKNLDPHIKIIQKLLNDQDANR